MNYVVTLNILPNGQVKATIVPHKKLVHFGPNSTTEYNVDSQYWNAKKASHFDSSGMSTTSQLKNELLQIRKSNQSIAVLVKAQQQQIAKVTKQQEEMIARLLAFKNNDTNRANE